mgnify:CR=1 FL=1
MSISRSVLLRASKSLFLNRQASHRAFVKRAVKKFMPGETPAEAIEAALKLAAEGRGSLFTKLGENLTSLDDAIAVRDHYLGFLDQLPAQNVPGQVSVKPTQLRLALSQRACAQHLAVLAAKESAPGAFLLHVLEDSI